MAELVWRGPDGEVRLSVPEGGGIIGRSPHADLTIAHASVSRRHARLDPNVDGSWRITDLGSRNGVIVRSTRTHGADLAAGDPIQLGDIVLHLVLPAPPPRPPVDDCADGATEEDAGGDDILGPDLVDPDDGPGADGDGPIDPRRFADPFQRSSPGSLGTDAASDGDPDAGTPGTLPDPGPAVDADRERLVFGEVVSSNPSTEGPPVPASGEGTPLEGDAESAPPGSAEARTPALPPTREESPSGPEILGPSPRRLLLAGGVGIAIVIGILLARNGDGDETDAGRDATATRSAEAPLRPAGDPRAVEGGGALPSGDTAAGDTAARETAAGDTAARDTAARETAAGDTASDAPDPEAVVPPLLDRLLLLEPDEVERAWSASALVLGRAPTPEETWLHARRGLDAFLDAASARPEHWRHRASVHLGSHLGIGALPPELLPDEVPLDLASWAHAVETSTIPAGAGAPGTAGSARAERPLPLPAADGSDAAYRSAVRARLEEGPVPLRGARAALLSVWTAGAGRPLDDEVERRIDGILASGIVGDCLVTRLLGLVSAAHPVVRDPRARTLDLDAWRRLLPPRPSPEPAGASRAVDAIGEGGPAASTTSVSWSDDWRALGVEPASWWAAALATRLPRLPAPERVPGPPGRLRLEVLAPFDLVPLLEEPERIPRLWRRLSASHLWVGAAGEGDPVARFDELARPGPREVLVLSPDGEGEAVPGRDTASAVGVRTADGFLLPEIAVLAARLGVHSAPAAPTEDAAAWLDAISPGRDRSGERLFLAGGYRLVPGEWRASAYRPPTRAILCAGAQLLERPGTDVVVRVVLTEEPSDGVVGEWSEWMSALELVAKGRSMHTFELWFHGRTDDGRPRGVGVEWGPQVRTGWVERLDLPIEAVHPRRALPDDEDPSQTDPTTEEER